MKVKYRPNECEFIREEDGKFCRLLRHFPFRFVNSRQFRFVSTNRQESTAPEGEFGPDSEKHKRFGHAHPGVTWQVREWQRGFQVQQCCIYAEKVAADASVILVIVSVEAQEWLL